MLMAQKLQISVTDYKQHKKLVKIFDKPGITEYDNYFTYYNSLATNKPVQYSYMSPLKNRKNHY